jgi:hypothetical protein
MPAIDRQVYVVGLPRSGTTWLAGLIGNNFAVPQMRDKWKHHFPDNGGWEDGALFFVIAKKLPHWINSARRWKAKPPSGNPYILQKIYKELGEGHVTDEKLRDLYKRFYSSWSDSGRDGVFVLYESLLKDPSWTLRDFEAKLGLMRLSHRRNGFSLSGPQWDAHRRSYYLGA